MKARICWKSRSTGRAGRGKPILLTLAVAMARWSNEADPGLLHWVELEGAS